MSVVHGAYHSGCFPKLFMPHAILESDSRRLFQCKTHWRFCTKFLSKLTYCIVSSRSTSRLVTTNWVLIWLVKCPKLCKSCQNEPKFCVLWNPGIFAQNTLRVRGTKKVKWNKSLAKNFTAWVLPKFVGRSCFTTPKVLNETAFKSHKSGKKFFKKYQSGARVI